MNPQTTTPVTPETYVRAETDRMFRNIAEQAGGVNHFREVTPLDKQTVVRMNSMQPRKRLTILVMSALVVLSALSAREAAAAVTVYTDRAAFMAAVSHLNTASFDFNAESIGFKTNPYDFGDFSATTNNYTHPPRIFVGSDTDVDGTNHLRHTDGDGVKGHEGYIQLTFDSPISAFGFDWGTGYQHWGTTELELNGVSYLINSTIIDNYDVEPSNDHPPVFGFFGVIDDTGTFTQFKVVVKDNPTTPTVFDYWGGGNIGIDNLVYGPVAANNTAPTANAGTDQAIHAGQTVYLDGSGSFDDNTLTASLGFAWTITQKPAGSTATLSGANTISPTFVADRPGDYKVQLVVTDSNSAASAPDEVLISSNNANPTANAGADQTMVLVGHTVSLSGAASTDADGDPLTYAWTLATKPVGSGAMLPTTPPGVVSTSFGADLPGTYTATLTVSDGYGSATDSVTISVITGAQFAESEIVIANTIIEGLSHSQVTTAGNQQALQNFLGQAIRALQANDTAMAINKVQDAIARTDGCGLRGAPDGAGPGRDWVTVCQAQGEIYAALTAALDALTP